MNKFGRPLRFGVCLNPAAANSQRTLRLASLAEALGLDYVGIREDASREARHDPWTLPAAIGAATSRISLFTVLTDLPSPESIARAAASLDLLTDGRVEIGIGTHAQLLVCDDSLRAVKDTPAALEEAIQIMRLLWSGEPSSRFEGAFFRLDDTQPVPAPSRRIPVWLGGHDPIALALTARLADGWFPDSYPTVQPNLLETWSGWLDNAMESAGRDPAEIQRIWAMAGTIRDHESARPFDGTPKQWADWIAELAVELGIDTFLLVEGDDADAQLQEFALEVVPRVRELVGAADGEVLISSGLLRAYQGAQASGATPAEEASGEVDWVDETLMESFPASDPPASNSFT